MGYELTRWGGWSARISGIALLAALAVSSGQGASPAGVVSIDPARVTVHRVWADFRTNTLGQPSPDGRYLSFVDWETGDLAVRDLLTGENRRLTTNAAAKKSGEYAYFSTFAPDSRQIAYAWFNKDKYYELRVVRLEEPPPLPIPSLESGLLRPTAEVSGPGTGARAGYARHTAPKPRVLYRSEDVQFIKPAAWSADGKYILALFFGKKFLNQMVLVSATDGSVRVLKTPFWIYPKRMSLSPDGRYVAYGLNQNPPYLERDIYLLPTDGSPETVLIKHPANDLFPMWTPEGKSLLFASNRSGTLDLWLVAVDHGKPRGTPVLVKKDIGRMLPLGFTREGDFYYGLRTGTENAFFAALDPKTGKVLEAPTPVSPRFDGVNRSPDWSPDGKKLAYLTHVGTENQGLEFRVISIRNLETGEERQLGTPKLSYLNWLRWSPDGRSFLVGGSDTKNLGGLYRVDADSGKVTPLVRGRYAPPRGFLGVWSPGEEGIFYIHEDLRESFTCVRFWNASDGQERELYRANLPARLNNLALSPDGTQLAFGESDGNRTEAGTILVLPAAGGKPHRLLKLNRPELSGLSWSRNGKYLLYSRTGKPAPRLWRISVAGGKPLKLKLETNENARISVHPDGRRIAFTAGETHAEIWVMKNFLPDLRAGR